MWISVNLCSVNFCAKVWVELGQASSSSKLPENLEKILRKKSEKNCGRNQKLYWKKSKNNHKEIQKVWVELGQTCSPSKFKVKSLKSRNGWVGYWMTNKTHFQSKFGKSLSILAWARCIHKVFSCSFFLVT